MKKSLLILTAGLLAASLSQAQSVVLATFEFTDDSLAGINSQTFGTVGNIVLGTQFSTDAATDTFFNTSAGFGSNYIEDQQAAFTYTVNGLADNERLTFDSIIIDTAETGGANSFRIQAYAAGVTASAIEDPVDDGDTSTLSFTLNTVGYTLLKNGDSVIVGIRARDGASPPSRVDYDNLILNGTVSTVPEPSSYALLAGLLGLSAVMVRRRQA